MTLSNGPRDMVGSGQSWTLSSGLWRKSCLYGVFVAGKYPLLSSPAGYKLSPGSRHHLGFSVVSPGCLGSVLSTKSMLKMTL